MKGQQLKRTQPQTRTTRRHQRNRKARRQFAWHGLGILIAFTLVAHYGLSSPTEVLAVIGALEVGTKVWNAIWEWIGA